MGNINKVVGGSRKVNDSNVCRLGHALKEGQGVVADHLASVDPNLAHHGALQ